MKNKRNVPSVRQFTVMRNIVIIAMAVVIGFSACSFDDSKGQTETPRNISKILQFENISRLAFMGGSLIYNPDVGTAGQLSNGAAIAVRLSQVETDEGAANPDEKFKETWRTFGYFKVTSVSVQSITLAYSEYNDTGTLKPARTVTVSNGGSGDLNGDGLPDVTFAPPAFKRSGMENAVYLTFTASQGNGNVGMYSVIPEQYSRQAYPNGVMGVNPDGKLIIMKYQPSGERAAIRGAEHGDIVIDNVDNSYATIKNGSKFRSAAQRIGDTADDLSPVATNGFSDTNKLTLDENYIDTDEPIVSGKAVYSDDISPSAVTEEGEPPYFIADEFTVYATPQGLYNALPASLKSTSPSTGAAYIATLNEILKTSSSTLIEEVLNSKTFDPDFIDDANSLKSELTGSESVLRTVLTNRMFLAGAYPELCQTPAAQTLGDMFPLLSVSFSAGDTDNLIVDDVAADIRRANMQFASGMQNNSRAVYSGGYTSGYTNFIDKKTAIEKSFNDKFTRVPGGLVNLIIDAKYCNNGEVKAEVGLYGSVTSYWGKVEMGVGAAVLFSGQIEGLKSTASAKPILPLPDINIPLGKIIIGPVILDITLDGQPRIELSATANSANTFAGFIGMYGGRVWIGVDYGVKFKLKVIPVSAYFTPYAKAENVSETAYYAGPIRNIAPAEGDGEITIVITPYLYIGPRIKWTVLYAKVGVDVGLPNTLKVLDYGDRFLHSMDMTFAGKASAGIDMKILIFPFRKDLAEWYFTPPSRVALIKDREVFAKSE